MLARLHVLLPVSLAAPEGEQFPIYEYLDQGYQIHVFPPVRSDRPYPADRVEELRLDGAPAFRADALRIDFRRDSFDRAKDTLFDPPPDVVRRAINSFLVRLRHVARAPGVRLLDFPLTTWRVQYLNDDESELEKDDNFVRARGALQLSFSWVALTKTVWQDVQNLPVDYEPPPWDELLLDAQADLPRVGPAVVLATTALEVFISNTLDGLAERGSVPKELWSWINQRGDYLREPTVEEQFDALLKFLTGHSLKEETTLWEAFRNLKTARNSFVHEGRARIGGAAVSVETARRLVASASEIIAKVREWLPSDMHWPIFRHSIRIEASMKLA